MAINAFVVLPQSINVMLPITLGVCLKYCLFQRTSRTDWCYWYTVWGK